MKAISQAFADAYESRARVSVRQIRFKRRAHMGGGVYAYEPNFQTLRLNDYIGAMGSLVWNLDSIFLNEFRASNVTLRLKNGTYQWAEGNTTGGIFAPTQDFPQGFDPYLCEFKIDIGYELPVGDELLTVFTGYLVDILQDTESGLADIVLTGSEQKLISASAADTADTFTDEVLTPVPDGVNTEFRTVSTGVAFLGAVKKNAVQQSEGVAYTVSDVDKPGIGALVEFEIAPAAAAVLTASGEKWKANKTFGQLAAYLCDVAGITNRQIDEPVFPNISQFRQIDTEAEWAAGAVQQNLDTSSLPGSIRRKWILVDDFTDGNYTANPTWTVKFAGSFTVAGNKLRISTGPGLISTPLTQGASGTWRFNANTTNSDSELVFMLDSPANVPASNYPEGRGYGLRIFNFLSAISDVEILRYDGGGAATQIFFLAGVSALGTNEWRVTRTADGNFEVFKNGISLGTASDGTHNSGEHISFHAQSSLQSMQIDDIYYSNAVDGTGAVSTAAVVFESAEIDLLTTPTVWGILESLVDANGGTVSYLTNVASISGGPYDGFVATAGNGQIMSTLKRFIKLRVEIFPAAGSQISPAVHRVRANFMSTTVFIALAVFRGKTSYDGLRRLAFLSNSDLGFDGDGKMFFRSKAVSSTPHFVLSQSTNLIRIRQARTGFPDVVNAGQVAYAGSYYKEYNSQTLPETIPNSEQRFGKRISYQSVTDFFFANDADLATSMAQILHDEGYRPRRPFLVETKMIPHMELADVVELSFIEDEVRELNIWGDPLNYWAPVFGEDKAFLARQVRCKVVGLSFNFGPQTMEPTLREILS